MEIELRHLGVIVALADHGSIAAAAAATGQRPLAVATVLQRLEADLDVVLFVPAVPHQDRRESTALEPTAAGRRALRRVRHTVASAAAVQDVVRQLRRGSTNTVRVRSSVLPFEALLPFLRRALPDVVWQARSDTAAGAIVAVAAGDADLFFGLTVSGDQEWVLPPDVVTHLVVEETPSLVLPRSHPCAGDDVVDLARLATSTWALPAEPALERLVRDACRRSGFEPRIRFREDSTASALQLVAAGQAVSITSPVAGEDARTTLRRCRQIPAVQWTVAHRKQGAEPRIVRTVIEIARAGYAALAAQVPDLTPVLPADPIGIDALGAGPLDVDPRPGMPSHPVRFGSIAHPAAAPLVRSLHERAVLTMSVSGAREEPGPLLRSVRGGAIDLALGYDHPWARAESDPAVARRTLVAAEPVFIAVGPGHPIAGEESVTPVEAADLRFVETSGGGGPDAAGLWHAVALTPDIRDRTVDDEDAAALLLDQDLAMLVPATACDERLHYVRLDHPLATRRLFLSWRPDRITAEVIDPVAAEFFVQLRSLVERAPHYRQWLAGNPRAVPEM